jgi:hypothetical protein
VERCTTPPNSLRVDKDGYAPSTSKMATSYRSTPLMVALLLEAISLRSLSASCSVARIAWSLSYNVIVRAFPVFRSTREMTPFHPASCRALGRTFSRAYLVPSSSWSGDPSNLLTLANMAPQKTVETVSLPRWCFSTQDRPRGGDM